MELRNQGRQQQQVFWLASSCCLLVAVSVFLLVATGPDSGLAQHAKRTVNYGVLMRPRNKLVSTGRSMRAGLYRRGKYTSGTGSRALALSTGRSMSSNPLDHQTYRYVGPYDSTLGRQSARSASRSMGLVNERLNQKLRFRRGASSAARSSIGNILGQPTEISDSIPESLAHKVGGVTKNTCSCPEEADQQQYQGSDGDKLELGPEVTNESGAKSSTKNENISQWKESLAEGSLPVSGSTSGRAGGSQAESSIVPQTSASGAGGIMDVGKHFDSAAKTLSGGSGSAGLKHESEEEAHDPEEKMASASRHRNKGEGSVESVVGPLAEGSSARESGRAAEESAQKNKEKVEPVSGFKVKGAEDFADKAGQVKEDLVEDKSGAGAARSTSPLDSAKEKVFEGLKGKADVKEALIADKVGAESSAKESVLEQVKEGIEAKVEAGEQLASDKIGAKEELADSVAHLKHKKVHHTTTTTSTTTTTTTYAPTTQAPEQYEVHAESKEEGYAQAEKPAAETKAKVVHEPAVHHKHELPAKASYEAGASEPAKYKPVLSHLSPPLYESPSVEKLAPRCQGKMHDLTGVLNEILAAIERLGQRALVDEHIEYQKRESLSRKLAIIRVACEESRMAATVGQLRRLNESARTAGVELMRLANSKEGNEFEPSLRPLAIKTRKHYVMYRKACKGSTTSH